MKTWVLLSIVCATLSLVGALVVYANRDAWLPEKVPTHWGASGEPDAWTDRDRMLPTLLLMPGIIVVMTGVGLALPWLSPLKFKIEPFRPTYDFIMGVVIVMFAYLNAVILLGYVGVVADVGKWIICGSMLCLAALGNVLGKVKRNFYVGIRTPWTLASDLVWDRTHRVGAWLFTAGGLVGFVLALAGVNPLIALSVFGVAAITPVFYSLWLYKRLEKQGRLGER
jgi:uncharacterized membrane protein